MTQVGEMAVASGLLNEVIYQTHLGFISAIIKDCTNEQPSPVILKMFSYFPPKAGKPY
jgi:hypothetical protein